MILQLVCAFGLVCISVLIHALGTLEAITHFLRVWQRKKADAGLLALQFGIVRVVSVLLLLHFLEAMVWAGFFCIAELLPDFETAIYFSITSYTTVGYGDVVLPASWRLLGPIEAALGILMFGWSTGVMVAAITRIHGERLKLHAGQQPEGKTETTGRGE
jgi:voltage-gated potassium channel Kch